MASDMIQIAASGAKAARAALDITAQNIANASTEGYIRRSVNLAEQSSVSARSSYGTVSQYGVRVTGINRNADPFLQSEVRRTNSDAARADTLVSGLTNISDAVENSDVFESITSYQSALSKLTSSPTDSSLRANVLENARTMAQSFNVAHNALASAMAGQQQAATAGVAQVNNLATSLSQLNLRIASDTDPQNNRATLLDERDSILQQLSGYGDIATTFAENGTVDVKLGGSAGRDLVTFGTTAPLASTTASDGQISFTLGGGALTLAGGSLSGQQQTLTAAATANTTLDGIANALSAAVNNAQTTGADVNGAAGTAMFTGSGAKNLAVALTSGSKIATAPAGSPAGSQISTNLDNLRSAMTSTNIAGQMNDLLYSLASAVAGNTTTRDALASIASNSKTTLANQAGVDLDTEAANLVKYQQAFQASGKVIQVASTLFDQLLQL
jgi:flagellar hook-associated protein 1 FlgK